ncbi:MAG: hypothetical protein ACOYVK_00860 [Bacillota bacterium]
MVWRFRIEKQLHPNANNTEVKGSIFFSYKSLENNPTLSAAIEDAYQQRDGNGAKMPVNVSRPSDNIRAGLSQFYLNGSSDPE